MPPDQLFAAPLDSLVVRLVLSAALGMFLGLEREWSDKTAGVRTFSLICLAGAVFAAVESSSLLVVGGILVVVLSLLTGIKGLVDDTGLSLTTSVSMLVTYGVGVLVSMGEVLAGVTVAVISSLLLVLKRELHGFAGDMTHEELRSAAEFAILAFVIYPLLPTGSISTTVAGATVAVEPRVVWLMVVFVAGLEIVNYAIINTHGGRGIVFTGFFGGLASSTAVVGAMVDHVRREPGVANYAIAAIMLADAAMALRNLLVAILFTTSASAIWSVVAPLTAVIAASVAIAFATVRRGGQSIDIDVESPFSIRNALGFGAMFLVIIVVGGVAEATMNTTAFYLTAGLSGLVSSAGATTSAVVLYRTGQITASQATVAIGVATSVSIGVKAVLAAVGTEREFVVRTAAASLLLIAVTAIATVAVI